MALLSREKSSDNVKMEIKAYKKTVEFRKASDGEVGSPLEVIAALDSALLRKSKGQDYEAFARPVRARRSGLAEGFSPQPYSAEVVLAYKDKTNADLSRLYSDWQSLEISNLLPGNSVTVIELPRPYGDEEIQFDWMGGDEHSLMDPLTVFYHENRELRLKEQQNELRVMGTGAPGKRTLAAIESLTKSEGASVEIRTSKLSSSEGEPRLYSINVDSGTSFNMRAPEVNIKISWPGENFDRKGIYLFSKVRELLYLNHVKAVQSHIPRLMEVAYGKLDGGVIISDESRDKRIFTGDIVAHLSSKVPFQAGDKSMVADLSYHHFRGR